jgi:hypothetical protein
MACRAAGFILPFSVVSVLSGTTRDHQRTAEDERRRSHAIFPSIQTIIKVDETELAK